MLLTTIECESPPSTPPRRPLLHQQLTNLQRFLNLADNSGDSSCCAVVMLYWSTILRVGDLLSPNVPSWHWDPEHRTHRGRLRVSASSARADQLCALNFLLRQTKNDQANIRQLRRIYDAEPAHRDMSTGFALSAIQAIDDA